MLIAFPLQQWLHERALVLRYTRIASLVKYYSVQTYAMEKLVDSLQVISVYWTGCEMDH
jgi:hypothetical protein